MYFFLYLCMVNKNKFGIGHFVCDNWYVKKRESVRIYTREMLNNVQREGFAHMNLLKCPCI